MNTIKSSRTEADYHQALAWVVAIFEASPGSSEFDKLDILDTLVCAYKDPHSSYSRARPHAQYIKYKMALHDNPGLSAEMLRMAT